MLKNFKGKFFSFYKDIREKHASAQSLTTRTWCLRIHWLCMLSWCLLCYWLSELGDGEVNNYTPTRMVNYLLLKNKNLLIKSTKIFKLNNVGKLCVRVVIDYAILCQRSCWLRGQVSTYCRRLVRGHANFELFKRISVFAKKVNVHETVLICS